MFVRTLYEPLKNHKCYQWTFKERSLNYLFSLAGLLGVRLPIVLEGHGWMSKFTLCGQCIASCQTPHWCHGELLTLRWLTALVGHCWLSDSPLEPWCIVDCEIAYCTGGALLVVRRLNVLHGWALLTIRLLTVLSGGPLLAIRLLTVQSGGPLLAIRLPTGYYLVGISDCQTPHITDRIL